MRLLHALAVVLVVVLTGCGTQTSPATPGARHVTGATSGQEPLPVPDILRFTAQTVAGNQFDGTSLAGRPTVLWFWAPWCPTCRAQIAGVGDLAAKYGDRINVVGVGSLDDHSAIEEFAGYVSPNVTLLADEDGAVWRHFGVTAQSTYLVLDVYGTGIASGYLDDTQLAELVDELVR